MCDNTRFYSEYGNLSYEFDDEHQDHELALIEFDLLDRYLSSLDNALHLCCGAGRHLVVFAEKGIRSIGIDISPFLVQQASFLVKRKRSELQATAYSLVGDVTRLPFSSNSFQCITVLGNSLCLLSDEQVTRIFEQADQVMPYGGVLILDIPDFEQMKSGSSALTTSINVSKKIHSTTLGSGVLHWHRFHDPKNNQICSNETLVFNEGDAKEKKIESHFAFHIILPQTLRRKATAFNMELLAIKTYEDGRGKYRGMLAKRIFMIFVKTSQT